MLWAKGQSGNPHGRLRTEKLITDSIRKAVHEVDPKTGRRKFQKLGNLIVDKALEGEIWAIQMVADRLDGKPAQESTVNLSHRTNVREFNDDELLEMMHSAEQQKQTHESPESVQ